MFDLDVEVLGYEFSMTDRMTSVIHLEVSTATCKKDKMKTLDDTGADSA